METKFSYLKSQNADYIEELYQRYLQDPNSIDDSWKFFFDGMAIVGDAANDEDHAAPNGHANGNGANGHASNGTQSQTAKPATGITADSVSGEAKVSQLIAAYRRSGHTAADLNPLQKAVQSNTALNIESFGLTAADLEKTYTAAKVVSLPNAATLREIVAHLRETYCSTIGVEYNHVVHQPERDWLEKRMEPVHNKPQYSTDFKKLILRKLTEAESFERFLHTKFVAQKRFSLEGAESFIPMLEALIIESSATGATDVVLGMAHRGRLNVLTNIFGKKYEHIFSEFDGKLDYEKYAGEGDVKYHMGYSRDYITPTGNKVHLSMASNPSHLEFVNPVVTGVARAKLELAGDTTYSKVIPVQIHGDAAFAGQGVVYETLQLSRLRAYTTGGSIHIVINNQVGFTTDPIDSRSTMYATDLAKMLESPIFHVNGDDPEAVVFVTQLALQYRQAFHKDVVIDLVCYRKYGHNEGDEPSFTQPLMYKVIKDHPSTRELYAKHLLETGALSAADIELIQSECLEKLNASYAFTKAQVSTPPDISVFKGEWQGLRYGTEKDFEQSPETGVNEKLLKEFGKKLVTCPQGFTPHPKLVRLLEQRGQMVEKGEGIDWGAGEALAFASLVNEGTNVRITGQDCERGTFSHRHSVLYDFNTNKTFTPLNNLAPKQGKFMVHNSFLSETGVLGFEYGYSLANPRALVIWEAQFGDFANGAQVIIDQFLASSESKWHRMSGMALLLPHGYEGQGPEHSSARLERFLQLCGRLNMQVCNLTTPAQIFHALRRQVNREFRKPLVVMSPKSLLRNPAAVSSLSDFTSGGLLEVIQDPAKPQKVRKILFCTGKVYYDLAAARDAKKIDDVAIVRVEQLYPWPEKQIAAVFKKYATAKEVAWVQEEPRNMGAWFFIRDRLAEASSEKQKLLYIGRGPAAAPAVGYSKVHEKEQKAVVEEALK